VSVQDKEGRFVAAAGFGWITKTFFLAKIIHRISTRSLRDKKSLHENVSDIRDELRISRHLGSGWRAWRWERRLGGGALAQSREAQPGTGAKRETRPKREHGSGDSASQRA
jgi:hypothetical protein